MHRRFVPIALASLASVLCAAQVVRVGARPSTPPQPVLSDAFDGTSLSSTWSVLHPELATISVSGGALHLAPTQGGLASIWFQDAEGPLVYKPVTGDFTATTIVHARNSSNPTQPPPPPYRLCGLLARDPASASGSRDSVHVALGSGTLDAPPFASICAEDKTTLASQSDFVLYPIASADGELRLQRRGAAFELAYREIGAPSWSVLRVHQRPDLPATLHVGLMAYSASAPAAIEASFDEIVFAP